MVKTNLDVKQGDKVVVLVNGEKPAILSVGLETISIDGDMKPGTKIS
ncbi:MAG: hypothetical protein KKE05_02110 [Nanoarchaeota archaeon]|nr:hypothetical protein [Nanoarchaeota archaeon]